MQSEVNRLVRHERHIGGNDGSLEVCTQIGMKDTFAQAAQFAHACRNQKGGDHDVIIFVVVSARFIAEIPDVAREHVGIQSRRAPKVPPS